jgi:hypothetical protein
MVGGGRRQEEPPWRRGRQGLQPRPLFIVGVMNHKVVVHVDKRRTTVGVGTNSTARGHVCESTLL